MARMIPESGPNLTDSYLAEPAVYQGLSRLDDQFTVIHSLPWLHSAVKTLDKKFAPTGEIDFIILHPALGILAIEVKGGVFKYDRTRFVYLRTNKPFDPVGQIRRGTFTLTEWIRQAGVRIPAVGYAWIFPDVDMWTKPIPPAMKDPSYPSDSPLIDVSGMLELDKHIISIMRYWQQALWPAPLSQKNIEQIVDLICPVAEYNRNWHTKIELDNRTWLTLIQDQTRILKKLLNYYPTVITGRPGTGKTVLAIALARHLAQDGRRVLFLLFNSPIARKIRDELNDTSGIAVQTFHGLCNQAELALGWTFKRDDKWFAVQAPQSLIQAIQAKKLPHYDTLIVDEGQIFRPEWWSILTSWIPRVHVFCDDTQVFYFEPHLHHEQIADLIGGDETQMDILTVNMRSPKTVFERIRAALPSGYQQFSPRQFEDDTLTEMAVLDPEQELRRVLVELNRDGVPPKAIAVIHDRAREYPEEIKQLASTIDTSARLRGMEFPIVIAHHMSFTDTMYQINAYARATTKVIAIYSIWDLRLFENPERIKDPFVEKLLENPEISEAINDPWQYLLRHLGWQLTPLCDQAGAIFWNHTLSTWVCRERIDDTRALSDEVWVNHLLLNTPYPVYICRVGLGYLSIKYYELAQKSLIGKPQRYILDPITCTQCERLCLKNRKSGSIQCAYCNKTTPTPFPETIAALLAKHEQILTHPAQYSATDKLSLGPHLFVLGMLGKLTVEQRGLLEPYVFNKLQNRSGYQPLLAITGYDILAAPAGQIINFSELERRYRKWFGPHHTAAVAQILPSCAQHWVAKKWLEQLSPDTYRRLDYLPSLLNEKGAEDNEH